MAATSELDKINKKEKSHHTHKHHPHTSRWHHADARVHYTVLTQHPEPATNTTTTVTPINQSGTHNKGIMPQTPNNAPTTYSQHYFCTAWTLLRMSQSTIQTLDTVD